MSRLYFPFYHLSIQFFSHIWHLLTMIEISSCHTHSNREVFDLNDLKNYRPFSNLCSIAKTLEKHLSSKVYSHLNSHNIYNTIQSANRPGCSTESAPFRIVGDRFHSLNKGEISVLAMIDSSSAFDTIDHTILVHRQHTDLGFTYAVLQWFSTYLTDRAQNVSLSNHCYVFALVHLGVPQCSIRGLILFSVYVVSHYSFTLYHTSYVC